MTFEIQAHRGARAFYPDNTPQAFCKAADLGCFVIELDLNVSNDLCLVVSHDPWVSASGDDSSKHYLYSMNYDEIAQLDCGEASANFPFQQSVRAVRPKLSEVFRTVEEQLRRARRPGEMIYNLEVKSWPGLDGTAHPPPEEYAALVIREIGASKLERRVRLQSFDDRILVAARNLAPTLCYGLLVEERAVFDSFPERPGFVPEYVNPRLDLVDESLVSWLHGLGAKVVVWTVNHPEDMLRMKRLGADGIITDHPEVALHLSGLSDS
ncbi:glycerophosphodiester phosphodiesterase [Chlorobaculum sp. MV4-Y]|jgi:glycerophosphoryl diester phosphodiesterase|uniref:glycerophosphodiester phosphodiesterase n=1 Tax=Chlorobaculum sp. MV4-Y TaxID=2976335 RepID=UPI0021AED513|nr:glycerophosphodiester phosphodiesterase [Chlorobaculum sp. MV4-Y]UWX57710.1 glycerophosphodiester phosphodiesterase [Chlorobaculum sp. MV4-Y]